MLTEWITREDLEAFRIRMLADIKELVLPASQEPAKKWLKHKEVVSLLGISTNTLQRLRDKGTLPSTKVGGVHYYRYEDIEKLFDKEVKRGYRK